MEKYLLHEIDDSREWTDDWTKWFATFDPATGKIEVTHETCYQNCYRGGLTSGEKARTFALEEFLKGQHPAPVMEALDRFLEGVETYKLESV